MFRYLFFISVFEKLIWWIILLMENRNYPHFIISKHCICLRAVDSKHIFLHWRLSSHNTHLQLFGEPSDLGNTKGTKQAGWDRHWAVSYIPKQGSNYMAESQFLIWFSGWCKAVQLWICAVQCLLMWVWTLGGCFSSRLPSKSLLCWLPQFSLYIGKK